jgi:hypothetical protein
MKCIDKVWDCDYYASEMWMDEHPTGAKIILAITAAVVIGILGYAAIEGRLNEVGFGSRLAP